MSVNESFEIVEIKFDDPDIENGIVVKSWNGLVMHPDTFVKLCDKFDSWKNDKSAKKIIEQLRRYE